MTALAIDRPTAKRAGHQLAVPAAAGIKLFAGGIVCLNATGYATKGATSSTLKAVGVATEQVDNTSGADGSNMVPVERGTWRFANSAGGDAITLANYGTSCYVVDDQTVALTSGGGTRSVAGVIRDVDGQGVWVEF